MHDLIEYIRNYIWNEITIIQALYIDRTTCVLRIEHQKYLHSPVGDVITHNPPPPCPGSLEASKPPAHASAAETFT